MLQFYLFLMRLIYVMSLRLIYTLILLLLFFRTDMAGQKHPQFRYISADAGINMAGIHSDSRYDRHKKNFGVSFGIGGNYSFSEVKSIGASISLDQKGGVDPVHDLNTNLNYITLPVYMKWIKGKDPRLFLTAGGYAAWLLNANIKGTRHLSGQHTTINESVLDNFRRFDYGIILETGMMVRLYDDFDFKITVGGSAGLSSISSTAESEKPMNYHFNIRIGYIYYIGFR